MNDYKLWAYYENEHVEIVSMFPMYDVDCCEILFSDGTALDVPANRLKPAYVLRMA